jgi:RNA polymerase sigma-70 factor (ECF subfamily)
MEADEFKYFVMPLKDKMFRFARRILRSGPEAEDLVQDAMIRLWHKRQTIRNDSNPVSFAMTITKNLCLDYLRSKYNMNKTTDIDTIENEIRENAATPDAMMMMDESDKLVRLAIDSLPEKLRMVIHLRDIEELSTAEAASVMGMTEGNLKVSLSRARKLVREIIEKQYNYEYEPD